MKRFVNSSSEAYRELFKNGKFLGKSFGNEEVTKENL